MKKTLLSLTLLYSTFSFGQVTYGLQSAFNLNGNFEEAYGGDAIDANVDAFTFVEDKFGNTSNALQINATSPAGIGIVNELFCSDDYSVTFLFKIDGAGTSASFSSARPLFFVKKESNSFFERIMLAYTEDKVYLKWANSYNSVDMSELYTVTYGEWYHAAITYSATKAEFYINGEFVDAITSTSSLSCDEQAKGFLGNVNVLDHMGRMNGAFDRIRIYDRILIPDHVEEIFEYDFNDEQDILTLSDVTAMTNISVVPNPANESTTIKVDGLANEFDRIEVIDLNGRIYEIMQVNSDEITLPLDQLASGMYVAKLMGKSVKTVRFQVIK